MAKPAVDDLEDADKKVSKDKDKLQPEVVVKKTALVVRMSFRQFLDVAGLNGVVGLTTAAYLGANVVGQLKTDEDWRSYLRENKVEGV